MNTLSRSSRNVIIITTSLLIVLVIVTMKLEADTISFGYPWVFYSYSRTGSLLQNSSSLSIQPVFFILEWLMLAALVIVVNEALKKFRP